MQQLTLEARQAVLHRRPIPRVPSWCRPLSVVAVPLRVRVAVCCCVLRSASPARRSRTRLTFSSPPFSSSPANEAG